MGTINSLGNYEARSLIRGTQVHITRPAPKGAVKHNTIENPFTWCRPQQPPALRAAQSCGSGSLADLPTSS
jgi:hypothetical protein